MISADKYSPILLLLSFFFLYKSHRASSHWRVDSGAPKIEGNRKVAKLLIKVWQETRPDVKPGLTEDAQVPYHGLGTSLPQYECLPKKTLQLKGTCLLH